MKRLPGPSSSAVSSVFCDGYPLLEHANYSKGELALAYRNKAMPLEGLRYDITPVGMHYTLIHFGIPDLDAGKWRLHMGGEVAKSLSLGLDELQQRPQVTLTATMECAGNGRGHLRPRSDTIPWLDSAVGTAQWTGTRLAPILTEAGLKHSVKELLLTGHDPGVQGGEISPYQRSLSLDEATRDDVLLVWAMNGRELEPQHGFPLRVLVPGWYGMTSVKWLDSITATSRPFDGYQMKIYRYAQGKDETGEPVRLMKPRALMIPPGWSDVQARTRILDRGMTLLTGRAWSGRCEITRVEVSTDDGENWRDATLCDPVSEHAWRSWRYEWNATPGEYVLRVRATDETGAAQPDQQFWTHSGMGNNMAQRVELAVV
ncbi:MAG: sulfite oxidase [Gammaproteobacteria bacterium]